MHAHIESPSQQMRYTLSSASQLQNATQIFVKEKASKESLPSASQLKITKKYPKYETSKRLSPRDLCQQANVLRKEYGGGKSAYPKHIKYMAASKDSTYIGCKKISLEGWLPEEDSLFLPSRQRHRGLKNESDFLVLVTWLQNEEGGYL